MNLTSSFTKKLARETLLNKYFGSVVAAAAYVFVFIICYNTAAIASVFLGGIAAIIAFLLMFVFLIIPLTLGYVFWSVRLTFAGDNEPIQIFKYFSSARDYRRALSFSLPFTGTVCFSGFILFVPCFFAGLISSGKLFTIFKMPIPSWAPGFWVLTTVMYILAIITFLLIMLKYYLAPFLMAANENMEPLEAMHLSKTISAGRKGDFLILVLSFIGYIIACAFVIPMIFIFPYFAASYSVHCHFAVAAYNKSIDNMLKPDIPSFNADISF
ncbi:MAG: DUF975 family protein [Clostridia bacterium]|nr:DUF975 family protein [Clostridia bacterium]